MEFLKKIFAGAAPKNRASSSTEVIEWSEREIADMTLRELQKELKKRHLDTRGTKKMLKRRLNEAVQRQRDMRLNEEAAKEKQRLIQLMREARGAVYVRACVRRCAFKTCGRVVAMKSSCVCRASPCLLACLRACN